MFYSHIEHYPLSIVYEFASACGRGKISELDNIFKQFNNQVNAYMDHQIKVLEYEYAFWFGLESAASHNQFQVIKYILNHPNLSIFKDNLLSMEELNKDLTQIMLTNFTSDKIGPIDTLKVIKVAAENCHFESFNVLNELNFKTIENFEEVYMEFFKKLTPNKYKDLLSFNNIKSLTEKHISIAIRNIVQHENIYGFNFIIKELGIDSKLIINEFEIIKDSKNNLKFIEMCLLDLYLNSSGKEKKINKI